MEEDKQSAPQITVDTDSYGNELLDNGDITKDDFLDAFREGYERLDIFTVDEIIKGNYKAKEDTPNEEMWELRTEESEEYESIELPYELRTAETEGKNPEYDGNNIEVEWEKQQENRSLQEEAIEEVQKSSGDEEVEEQKPMLEEKREVKQKATKDEDRVNQLLRQILEW